MAELGLATKQTYFMLSVGNSNIVIRFLTEKIRNVTGVYIHCYSQARLERCYCNMQLLFVKTIQFDTVMIVLYFYHFLVNIGLSINTVHYTVSPILSGHSVAAASL